MSVRFKFSVVIAAYNQRDHLLQAVESVVEQTYPAHEIIVVIDGSTDGSAVAVREAFPEVLVIEQENFGKCVARNTGIATATGDWICFLDHDDLWHREKLGVVAEYLTSNRDCKAVNHLCWFFGPADGPENVFGFERDFAANTLSECYLGISQCKQPAVDLALFNIKGNSFALLLERNRGTLSSSIVFRSVLIRGGCFSPMQANGEDWTMFLNVARLCEWHTIPQRLTFYRFHGGQDSNTFTDGGVYVLTGLVSAWYSGRPLKRAASGISFVKELAKYGPEYRKLVQTCLWGAIFARKMHLVRIIRALGSLLLPRKTDWLYAHVPPQITCRIGWQSRTDPRLGSLQPSEVQPSEVQPSEHM